MLVACSIALHPVVKRARKAVSAISSSVAPFILAARVWKWMQYGQWITDATPMGNKTKVEVGGDFRAQGMDDMATKKAALAMFEEVFNEDNANLKNYK